jgi:riboflavin kinase
MDEVLLYLIRLGAGKHAVRATTTAIGAALGMTQQNASRRLVLLECRDCINRTAAGISITSKGMKEARSLYIALKESFEGGARTLEGRITSGLGEGSYYMSLPGYREKIKQAAGIFPFAGTLNLRLNQSELWKKELLISRATYVPSFSYKGRKFGSARIYPCAIGKLRAAVIFPERTHHPIDIIEVIAEENLRTRLRKKDRDVVSLDIRGVGGAALSKAIRSGMCFHFQV